ncbi:MAG: DUF2075 domain-containing protein [Candidatus Pacebacteria bacterium]|nr:DUF2075 domain-containing protein [Candidatus Paceibacterota bacterium]
MVVYKNTATGFCYDVETNKIADSIELAFKNSLGRKVNPSEKSAWINSMSFMERIVRNSGVAQDCGVLIEYNIPATSKRIDFIIAGCDSENKKKFVIVELKQWQLAHNTFKDGLVTSFFRGGERETPHPSYQAYSYKSFLKDYNENIYNGKINPYSCAYLHNYKEKHPEPLKADIYKEYVADSPIYFQDDFEKLANFIKMHVGNGGGEEILYDIESGRIRPSKRLIDCVNAMFKGNQEFILLDEQKVAYETALHNAINSKEKTVIIVKGGPGTGKSVVSMNLFGGLLTKQLNTVFVAPNAAFRSVMKHKLAGEERRERLNHLFKGSAAFYGLQDNVYDAIVVDEAHRLKNYKAYQYFGQNQIEDIVKAGKTSIFFVDENQIIRPEDIGSIEEIKKIANQQHATINEIELQAQFRCSGSDGYINWLDNTLRIKETANFDGWEDKNFEFIIFDDPNDLRQAIKNKQNQGFDAQLLAGYAWKWTSAKEGNSNSQSEDVQIPEYNFSMPWNSRKAGSNWAIDESSHEQIGCVHTSQGLEFDYVGVIVGNDLRFDKEKFEYFVPWNSYKDMAGKKGLKNEPEKLCLLVKNIYKILMTRGIYGCYVFFQDKNLKEFIESRLKNDSYK